MPVVEPSKASTRATGKRSSNIRRAGVTQLEEEEEEELGTAGSVGERENSEIFLR